MMKTRNVSHRTIIWGLVALVAAMVADLLESLIDPASSGEGHDLVAAATNQHGRMVISALLLLASAAFLLPGVYTLNRLLDGKGRYGGRAATVLGLLGTMGHAALGGIYLIWSAMAADSGANGQLIAGIDRANQSASLAPLAVLFIAFPLSLVVTFVAMVRGRLAPRWVVVPAIAAPVAAIASIGGDAVATETALVFLLIATVALAVNLLARPASESEPRSVPVPA
jgi:hypothetical protein